MNDRSYSAWLLIAGFILLSLTACIKKQKGEYVPEITRLPAATQTGANTFGCLVNGQAFYPKVKGWWLPPQPLTYSYIPYTSDDAGLFISAIYDYSDIRSYVRIGIPSATPLSEGQTIVLNSKTPEGPGASYDYYTKGGSGLAPEYNTDENNTGLLTITKVDMNQQIISGTFSFNAQTTTGDIVKITDGRFDVHFH